MAAIEAGSTQAFEDLVAASAGAGMWPHMNGDWDHWDDRMNGPMMGG